MGDEAGRVERIIGERVRQRRVELGLTMEQLARPLGLSYQQIQKYERGANRIGVDRLLALARQLDLPLDRLLDGLDGASAPAPSAPTESRRSAIEIARLFAALPDAHVRNAIVALARAVAEKVRPGSGGRVLDRPQDP